MSSQRPSSDSETATYLFTGKSQVSVVSPTGHTHDGKLVDNFSHESDVTSLQDPFTSRPYKTPSDFTGNTRVKIERGLVGT